MSEAHPITEYPVNIQNDIISMLSQVDESQEQNDEDCMFFLDKLENNFTNNNYTDISALHVIVTYLSPTMTPSKFLSSFILNPREGQTKTQIYPSKREIYHKILDFWIDCNNKELSVMIYDTLLHVFQVCK